MDESIFVNRCTGDVMEKYIDLAEFKFEFEDRKSIETRCKVGSRLYVNDEFITDSGEN